MPESFPNQDLDLTLLNEIADGSDEFIVESIDMFLQQTPEQLQLIDDYIEQMDWPNAGAAAHKFKPTLGFFGMLNTQSLIQQVEAACKAGGQDLYDILQKLDEVKATLAVNIVTLKRLKAEAEAKL